MSDKPRYRIIDLNILDSLVQAYPKMTVESLIEKLSSPDKTLEVLGEVFQEGVLMENDHSEFDTKEDYLNSLMQ